jgi:GT2 family glycosyltransferase
MAQAAAELGELEAAERGFARAAELRESLAPAWVNLGMLRSERGDFDLAVEAFLKAQPLLDARPQPERDNLLAMLDQAIERALSKRAGAPLWAARLSAPALPALAGEPLASVIIPTCDRVVLLKDAVESACRQSYPNLEIIVVNDGKTDPSAALPRDPRVHLVVDGRRRGQAGARNLGVARARGEVLFFLDDDDLYLAHHVERLMAWLRESAAMFAYSDTRAVIESFDGQARRTLMCGEPFPGIPFSRARLHVRNHIPVTGWAVRRPLFDLLGGFDSNLVAAEDWEFLLRAAQYGELAYLAGASAETRIREQATDSVSKRNRLASYLPEIYRRFADRGDWLVAAARARYQERTADEAGG